jgi:hypothetical protein
VHTLCTPEATVRDNGGGLRGQEETDGRGRRGTGITGDAGSEEEEGTDDAEEARGLETLRTEMVERFVGLEMTLIHRLEVQDRKLEKAVAELVGEAQKLRAQGDRIIALLEAEDSSEDDEADAEGEDDQAVVAAVTEKKGEDEEESEDAEEMEETEETLQ